MWQKILNTVFFRRIRANRIGKKLGDLIGAEFTEEVFKLLLEGMALFFCVNRDFRKNLDGFNAKYLFKSKDGKINIAVIYSKMKMRVLEKTIEKTNVTVSFLDYKALIEFLTSPDPDVLDFMLNQKLTFDGNLNYLYKFGYMSRHLLKELKAA